MGRGRTRKTCVSDRHPCSTYNTFFCITLERLDKTNGMKPPRSGKRLGIVKILILLPYFNKGMQDRNYQFCPKNLSKNCSTNFGHAVHLRPVGLLALH